jgi:alpha-tubulin suppressor-like RCC1 family protein
MEHTMKCNRLISIMIAFLLLASLPLAQAIAAGVNPPLPEQSAAVKIQTISAARNNTCAIKTDSTVACWGENGQGQASPTASKFSQVTMGYYHACGLRIDGLVECWGSTDNGQTNGFPTGQTFTQISTGETHTFGIKPDGTLYCWGHFLSDNQRSFGHLHPGGRRGQPHLRDQNRRDVGLLGLG